MVNFNQYVPPGVYVQDTTSPLVTASGLPGSLVCIVGPGAGYQSQTEIVAANSGLDAAVTLNKRGVFTVAQAGPPAVGAPVVKTLAGTLLTVDVDYEFIVNTSQGTGANASTQIRRLADDADDTDPDIASVAGVVNGEQISVTYNYADAAYYTPQAFDSFDSFVDVYGEPFGSTATAVVSPLSLAAQVAFENGTGEVLAVATNNADGTYGDQLAAAYAKLEADYRVGVIVPLFVDGYVTYDPDEDDTTTSDGHTAAAVQSLINALKNHCVQASADGYGRIGVVGLGRYYDEATTSFASLAAAVSSSRIVLAYPNRLMLFNQSASQTIEVDGFYLAAALGGMLAANLVQRGLTRLTVQSFAGLPASVAQVMTRSFLDGLGQNGVLVAATDRLGNLVVRHGLTTDVTAINTREVSLVRIADTLFQSVNYGMDSAGLIGEPIDGEMTSKVKGALQGILEQQKASGLIVDYANLVVRQQALPSGDPTVIECKFAYQPPFPLNYITVQFQIDLSTGAVVVQDTDEA